MHALRRHIKAAGTVFRNYRQTHIVRKGGGLALARVYQRTNHAQIACINTVMSLHGLQAPAMKSRQHEALSMFVQMLSERQHVVTLAPLRTIHDTALHA